MLDSVFDQISLRSLNHTWFVLWAILVRVCSVSCVSSFEIKTLATLPYCIFFYAFIQVVFIIITMMAIKRTAATDDGAALMLVPGMMVIPSVLMLLLLSLRGVIRIILALWRHVGKNIFPLASRYFHKMYVAPNMAW